MCERYVSTLSCVICTKINSKRSREKESYKKYNKIYTAEYREKNKEKVSVIQKRYKEKVKDKKKLYNLKYQQNNNEKIKEYQKKYRERKKLEKTTKKGGK